MAPDLSFSEVIRYLKFLGELRIILGKFASWLLVMDLLLIPSAAALDGRAQVYYPVKYPAIQKVPLTAMPLSLPDSVPISLPVDLSQFSRCNCLCQYPYHSPFCYNYCHQEPLPGLRMHAMQLSRAMTVMNELD